MKNKVFVAAMVVLAMVVFACAEEKAPVPETTATPVVSASATAAPEPSASVHPSDAIKALPSFKEALEFARPHMADVDSDGDDDASLGWQYLTSWARVKMRWEDAAPKLPETTIALVKKDPDDERGKRLCITGAIVQIERKGKLGAYTGGILSEHDVVRFAAVRSTGDITKETRSAKFCGVVTNKVSYKNAVGGTTHAVQMVGMFDLPENRLSAAAP